MLAIVEILFLVLGLWGLVAGRYPGWLMNLVFGKGEYVFPPGKVRLFGLLLISPVVVAFFAALVLTMFFGERGTAIALILEIVYDLVVITVAVILARRVRQG